jgi:hypothetical protein
MAVCITSEELQLELETLAEQLGLSVQELLVGYSTQNYVDGELDGIRLSIQQITEVGELSTESIAEKIIKINEIIGTVPTEVVQSLFDRLAENKAATAAVVADLAGYKVQVAQEQAAQDAAIQANAQAISTVSATVTTNKQAQDVIAAKVVENTADIAKLNGVDSVVGSVDNKVKVAIDAEKLRTDAVTGSLAELTTDDKSSLVKAINEVDAHVDALVAATSTAQTECTDKCDATQAEVDSIEAAIGLNTDGTFTSIDGSDTLLEYVKNEAGDADSLTKAVKKLAKKSKQADTTLDGRLSTVEGRVDVLNGDDTVVGSVAKMIKDATGGNISDIAGRVTVLEAKEQAIEDILNDTVDAGNQVVKGLKTRVTEVEAAVVAEAAAREAADAALQAQVNTLAACAAGLTTSVIDGKKAANKFRAVFGQAPITVGGGTVDGGGGL